MRDKVKIIALCVALFAAMVSRAQDPASDSNKEQAQALIGFADDVLKSNIGLDQARELYEQAATLDPDNIYANFQTGEIYLRSRNRDRALKYLLKVYELNPNYKFNLLYMIGQAYQYGLDFKNALESYERYQEKVQNDPNYRGLDRTPRGEVDRRLFECKNGLEYIVNPTDYRIINVGSEINSEWPDYAPVLNEDETLLVFTTRRQEDNLNEDVHTDLLYFEDVFMSNKTNGKWQPAKNIGEPINHRFFDSNQAISARGDLLFLYKDDNNGDIFISDFKDGQWTEPRPIPGRINSSFGEKSVCLSADGEILIFSSDRPGGKGGLDLYYSLKSGKNDWGNPKSLGEVINTEFDDDSPFLDYDGKTLYFSSRGHKGIGQYDIFRSTYDSANAEWSEPVNLGFPINTPDDDAFFVSTKDGKRGYYASVREDGLGYTDIYMVLVPENSGDQETIAQREVDEVTEGDAGEIEVENTPQETPPPPLQDVSLLVRVIDASTGDPIENPRIGLRGIADNRVVGRQERETGIYDFRLQQSNAAEFALSVEKDGYIFSNSRITLPAATTEFQEMRRTVRLRKIARNVTTILRNIYFQFGKANFQDDSYTELNKLEKLLSENPALKIEISGHTDNIGSSSFNKQLSQRRADAVVDYLVRKGVEPSRLTSKGYGFEKPLASNDDEEEGRELNRRVEFKILQSSN